MKLARVAFALTVLSLPFAACDGCEDPLSVLAPVVAIGDPFDPTFSVCETGLASAPEDRFRDCAYNFGEVGAGRAKVFSFTVRNPSQVALAIESITLEPGSDPAFGFDGVVPVTVVPAIGNVGEIVNVKFQPTVEGAVSGVIRIKTDGENLDDDEDILINLSATGSARCTPDIVVSPAECNFGDVGVGATGFCDITISNDCSSACGLLVSDLGFSEGTDTAVFGAESQFPVPVEVACGTGRTLRLFARPTSVTTFTGALEIESYDPDEQKLVVPLTVRGAEAPTCVARVGRINNVPNPLNNSAPSIEPLDDVELSADQAVAARAGGTIVGWEWRIVDQPAESNARLRPTNAQTTRFAFDSSSGVVNGIDVAGTFIVGLIVTDDSGAESTECTIALNSVPGQGLHVQLTWDRPDNDIDLHLARNGTNWCGADDCFFRGRNRAWGATLDIDDLEGFGPENITMDSPADGRYTVGVGVYTNDSATTATIKIFVGGGLEYEGQRLLNGGPPWLPARAVITGGVTTIEELDTVSDQPGDCWGAAG
jgi:hypothetical protein